MWSRYALLVQCDQVQLYLHLWKKLVKYHLLSMLCFMLQAHGMWHSTRCIPALMWVVWVSLVWMLLVCGVWVLLVCGIWVLLVCGVWVLLVWGVSAPFVSSGSAPFVSSGSAPCVNSGSAPCVGVLHVWVQLVLIYMVVTMHCYAYIGCTFDAP